MAEEAKQFSERAIELVADSKIRAAIEAGEFDNLPGFGKPCLLIDEGYDPYWWVRRKLAREDLRTRPGERPSGPEGGGEGARSAS